MSKAFGFRVVLVLGVQVPVGMRQCRVRPGFAPSSFHVGGATIGKLRQEAKFGHSGWSCQGDIYVNNRPAGPAIL